MLSVDLRPAGIDCWSDIRNLHVLCIRKLAETAIETSDAAAFASWIYSPDYTDALLTHDVQTAWHDGRLVATAGWVPSDDAGSSARITSVFVSPLFSRLGIGRRIVGAAEARARAAGFHAFATRAFQPAVPFFEALGYRRSSQGKHAIGTENGIPVTFMRRADGAMGRPAARSAQGSPSDEPPTSLVTEPDRSC